MPLSCGHTTVFGLACFKCNKFKEEKCPGCEPNEFCKLPECAQNKDVECCFECKEFPCKLNYEEGPLQKDVLDFHKEK